MSAGFTAIYSGRFKAWEIRVGDFPASNGPRSNTDIDTLRLCQDDHDCARPGAYVLQIACKTVLLGRYIAIRLKGTDWCDSWMNAPPDLVPILHLCEVQPFTREPGACSSAAG